MEFSEENVREQMESLANGIVSALNKTDPVHSRELLSQFVSELFLSVTKQALREERRKKQAGGIARAKARGVRFGSRQKPLPENFEEARRSWRGGETSLKEAAKLCGMPTTTFYDAVRRAEESEPGENEEEVPRC